MVLYYFFFLLFFRVTITLGMIVMVLGKTFWKGIALLVHNVCEYIEYFKTWVISFEKPPSDILLFYFKMFHLAYQHHLYNLLKLKLKNHHFEKMYDNEKELFWKIWNLIRHGSVEVTSSLLPSYILFITSYFVLIFALYKPIFESKILFYIIYKWLYLLYYLAFNKLFKSMTWLIWDWFTLSD